MCSHTDCSNFCKADQLIVAWLFIPLPAKNDLFAHLQSLGTSSVLQELSRITDKCWEITSLTLLGVVHLDEET